MQSTVLNLNQLNIHFKWKGFLSSRWPMVLSLHLFAKMPRKRHALLVMGARAVQLVLEEEKNSQLTPHVDDIRQHFFLGTSNAFYLILFKAAGRSFWTCWCWSWRGQRRVKTNRCHYNALAHLMEPWVLCTAHLIANAPRVIQLLRAIVSLPFCLGRVTSRMVNYLCQKEAAYTYPVTHKATL